MHPPVKNMFKVTEKNIRILHWIFCWVCSLNYVAVVCLMLLCCSVDFNVNFEHIQHKWHHLNLVFSSLSWSMYLLVGNASDIFQLDKRCKRASKILFWSHNINFEHIGLLVWCLYCWLWTCFFVSEDKIYYGKDNQVKQH